MIRARKMGALEFSPRRSEVSTTTMEEEGEWELRPGGMLVQKRSPDSESPAAAAGSPVPTIRVKVKHESAHYEIYIGAQSTFGELKKLLAERTGMHHQDQKILYKDKERESGAFLDVCGVKDKSKLMMVVDPTAHAKRMLEMRRAARLEKAAQAVKDIAAEVDNLALQVSNREAAISQGNKIADKDISNLIEQLMTQLIKLDGIITQGDLKLQRGMQVRRVQKYVETLDVLKIKNAKIMTPMPLRKQNKHLNRQPPPPVVVTTEWETFDSLFAPSTSTSTSTTTTTTNSTTSSTIAPRSDWELF